METQTDQFEALGTTIIFEATAETFAVAFALVQAEAERIEAKFSRFRASSQLSYLNKNLDQWIEVDDEFYDLLAQAQLLNQQTAGYFNIGLCSTLEHWGYDADYNLKSKAEVAEFTSLNLQLKPNQACINTTIDFGAFGKGYFLDQAHKILAAQGINHYVLNAGGDLRCASMAEPWKLFFEDPRVLSRVIGEVEFNSGVLCSSAPSRRQWGVFHHLIDPHKNQPADQMSALYVQHPHNGAVADALSTALFVMGFKEAQAAFPNLSELYPELAVMLISEQGKVWRSENFKGDLYTT